MEPTRDTHATLVDLLDRILDKGLVINADLIVSVAGIPLIGVNLRAALAGMETMLKYGVMQAWDERTRAWERVHRQRREPILAQGEQLVQRVFGSYYGNEGIYTAWRSGIFYVTSRRLFLYNRDFDEMIFQTPLEEIRGLAIRRESHFTGEQREELCLLLDTQGVARLHTADVAQLKTLIEEAIEKIGVVPEEHLTFPEFEESAVGFLAQGERVIRQGKMWYLMVVPAPGRATTDTWKSGHLYLTNKRLCWWYDFEQRLAFQVPVDEILKAMIEPKDTGGIRGQTTSVGNRSVLAVSYNGAGEVTASFSGNEDELRQWERVLSGIISGADRETCPRCSREAPVRELLESGCPRCGWVSPRRAEAAIA